MSPASTRRARSSCTWATTTRTRMFVSSSRPWRSSRRTWPDVEAGAGRPAGRVQGRPALDGADARGIGPGGHARIRHGRPTQVAVPKRRDVRQPITVGGVRAAGSRGHGAGTASPLLDGELPSGGVRGRGPVLRPAQLPTTWRRRSPTCSSSPDCRRNWSARGHERLAMFSWRRTAEVTHQVYLDVGPDMAAPMRVFVEGTPLFRQRTGVGQYTKNLLEALFRLDETNHYTIFSFAFLGRGAKRRPIPASPRVGYRFIRYMHLKVFNAIVRKLTSPPIDIMLGSRPDLFIFPNFVRYPLPLGSRAIAVILRPLLRAPRRAHGPPEPAVPHSIRASDDQQVPAHHYYLAERQGRDRAVLRRRSGQDLDRQSGHRSRRSSTLGRALRSTR